MRPMSDYTGDDSLHLPSLRIEGFRGIDSLTINRFGRVTLLAGRNGTGKTTVLDAVRIFADRGRLSALTAVLDRSEEYAGRVDEEKYIRDIPDFGALFHGRQAKKGTSFTIGLAGDPHTQVVVEVSSTDDMPEEWMSRLGKPAISAQVLRIAFGHFEEFLPVLDGDLDVGRAPWRRRPIRDDDGRPKALRAEVLGPGLLNNLDLDQRWGEIALTEQEPVALRALNLAANHRIDGVAVVSGDTRYRSRRVLVKLEDGERVPLRSLGDGAVRLFGVAVALAGAAGGLLLIDEAENGIHRSLQHEYWRLVLRAAADNDVQVIATTHGWDCIRGFASAASENHDVEGVVVRLERENGGLRAVEYSEEELQTATGQGIEIR
ncbi:MAG: AAA family ATPase [Acidimicrobiaceae bacterium]|nr:AAA family ATPase [Acidimicrobiaceae bacterium]